MRYPNNFILIVAWVAGIVIAHGILFKVLAALFPIYAWYLIVERLLNHFGLL